MTTNQSEGEIMAIKVVTWHGESKTLYLVVNYDVSDETVWEIIGQSEEPK